MVHFAVGRHLTAPFLKALAGQQCHTKFWFGDGLPDGRLEVAAAFRSRGQRVLGPPCTDARDRSREAACAGAKQLETLLRGPVVPRAESLQRGTAGDVAAACGASLQHACAAWQRGHYGSGIMFDIVNDSVVSQVGAPGPGPPGTHGPLVSPGGGLQPPWTPPKDGLRIGDDRGDYV